MVHRNTGAPLYSEMLSHVQGNLQFTVLFNFGNDWYTYTVRPLTQPTRVAAEQFCLRMQSVSRRQVALVGGSSDTWGYKAWMQPHSMNQFDANADALCKIFTHMGICAVTGADELHELKLADRIGHVSADPESKRVAFDAYHTWLTICLWEVHATEGSPSELTTAPDLPAPPPPPPVPLHEPLGRH